MITMSVTDRVTTVATFRSISIRLMELLARWTPTTPEMEVKVLFGRHIWDFAQHADALGKRTFELRRPEHYTLAPADSYLALLADVTAIGPTADRIAAFYDGLLPGLRQRYADYIAATDPVLDQPTIVIFERIVGDLDRQRRDAAALRNEIGLASPTVDALLATDAAITNVVAGERRTA